MKHLQAAGSQRPNGSPWAKPPAGESGHKQPRRRSLNRPENASRLASYYAMFLTLCGLVLTICVLEHSNNTRFSEAAQWTQLIFFLCVLTGALGFLFWLMGYVMRLPPQSVPQHQIREFRGRANSVSVYPRGSTRASATAVPAAAPAPATVAVVSTAQPAYIGRRNSEDAHVYDNFRDPKNTVAEASPEEEERGDRDSDEEVEAADAADQGVDGGQAAANGCTDVGVGNAAYAVEEEAAPANCSAAAESVESPEPASKPASTKEATSKPVPSASIKRLTLQLPKPSLGPRLTPATLEQNQRKNRLNTITINSAIHLNITEIPPYTLLTKSEAHSPAFFLRIAAIVFGSAGVVNMLVKAVDALLGLTSSNSQALEVFKILRCLINIAFNGVQTFFLFKYSKISIAYRQKACLFGLSHVLATNLCLWIGDLGEEKLHKYHKLHSGAKSGGNATAGQPHSGSLSGIMAPYLYPFNIEYSLMAAFFCHALFRNVGAFISLLHGRVLHVERKSFSMRNRTKTRFSVSCHKSTKGLLLGMGLVLAVICVSAYVLNLDSLKGSRSEESGREKRLIISSVMLTLQLVLLAMVIPVILALRRLPRLQHPSGHADCGGGAAADKLMLQLGLAAVIVSQMYVLLEVAASSGGQQSILDQAGVAVRVCEALAIMVQSALQVLALDLGLERNFELAPSVNQGLVTALIPANLAVWVFYTLTGPVSSLDQSETSRVISALCLPVVIFFRFHSVGCFAELWKLLQQASEPDLVASRINRAVISSGTGR